MRNGVITGIASLACALGCLAALHASAQADDTAPQWYDTVSLHGFVSAAYDYNANKPASGSNAYRVFDLNTNSFGVDVMELSAQRLVDDAQRTGFRVDVVAGSSVPHVSAARGLFRADDGTAEDIDLQQAYASILARCGSGLRVDAGKFITPFGYEVIEGYDGWNDNATRSLLFGYVIPFTHTGVRAGYTFSPVVAATALLVNGWDNAVDNNTGKSFGAQVAVTPSAAWSLIGGGMVGPERDHSNGTLRELVDASVVWKARPALTLGLNGDWGRDDVPSTGTGGTTPVSPLWKGVAAYVRAHASSGAALSLRGEVFDDTHGARTGTAQTLKEVTVTPEYAVSPSFVLRADLRWDWSDALTFDKEGVPVDHQFTVRGNVVVTF